MALRWGRVSRCFFVFFLVLKAVWVSVTRAIQQRFPGTNRVRSTLRRLISLTFFKRLKISFFDKWVSNGDRLGRARAGWRPGTGVVGPYLGVAVSERTGQRSCSFYITNRMHLRLRPAMFSNAPRIRSALGVSQTACQQLEPSCAVLRAFLQLLC